jgi:hypothetical protein
MRRVTEGDEMTIKTDVPIEASFFFCIMSALSGLLVGFLLGAAADKAENDSLQSRIERLEAAEQ